MVQRSLAAFSSSADRTPTSRTALAGPGDDVDLLGEVAAEPAR